MNPAYASVMPINPRPDLVFVAGNGSWLEDAAGRRYLDFIQGWAVNALGHSHPRLVAALQAQAARLLTPSPAYYNAPMVELAGRLAASSVFDHVTFTNSGAEANEAAIKLARKWGALQRGGAHRIITFDNAFHGRTLATMSASGKAGWEALFEPKVPGFVKLPYNDLDAVAEAIDDSTVAVMLEPIQGEAGVIPASLEFVQGLRRLTRARGALLIFDEVQTGMGRTGTLFAYQRVGVEPDIMTLGKGLGGGVPLAAMLATRSVSCFAHGDQGGTYNGNPLACAAGVAVFDTVNSPGFLAQVRQRGDVLRAGLEQLAARHGLGEVRGRGLLLAMETGARDANRLVADALAAGLLLNAPRPHILRFMPALTVSGEEVARMLEILDELLRR